VHRMPTAAVLAVVVATTATGCMTVNTRPAPTGPPRPDRPAPAAQPPGPQNPQRETRSTVTPTPPPDARKKAHRPRPDGTKDPRTARVPDDGKPGGAAAGPPPAPVGGGRQDAVTPDGGQTDRTGTSRVPRIGGMPAVPRGSDICELGRAYGHWQHDDAAQRICGSSYGN
jgi:hypothetical protein